MKLSGDGSGLKLTSFRGRATLLSIRISLLKK